MGIGIVDAIIILSLLTGFVFGFKRGLIKQLFSFVGLILMVILAFHLKTPVFNFMIDYLPFFNFGGIFKGITSLNILIYELLAFFIVLSILMIIYRVILFGTGLIEKILNFTIILGIPSKILGGIVGILEAFVYVYFVLYILTLPFFNIKLVNESTYKNDILTKTPILSNYASKTIDTFIEIASIKDKFKDTTDSDKINRDVLDIMLKNKLTKVESIDKLVKKEKIKVLGIESILSRYR